MKTKECSSKVGDNASEKLRAVLGYNTEKQKTV